ncbi:MAG: replication-relaxation family protein [Actinomycetota bacterium]
MPSGKNSRPSIELQDRDLAIFRGLFESRLMTLGHIARLYFDGRPEAAKKRIQGLKSARYLGERSRRVYEPSILHLRERAFTELSASGAISEYPRFKWKQLQKRLQVSDSTLRHELDVLEVKTSLSSALSVLPRYELVEFSTWPLIYQFQAAQPPRPGTYQPAKVLIRPDGFMRIYEHTNEDDFEHFLYLEVDRSTEPHETLALRTYGYQDYFRRGGLAVRYGGSPEDYKAFPFLSNT